MHKTLQPIPHDMKVKIEVTNTHTHTRAQTPPLHVVVQLQTVCSKHFSHSSDLPCPGHLHLYAQCEKASTGSSMKKCMFTGCLQIDRSRTVCLGMILTAEVANNGAAYGKEEWRMVRCFSARCSRSFAPSRGLRSYESRGRSRMFAACAVVC